jgi:hypothetical protein
MEAGQPDGGLGGANDHAGHELGLAGAPVGHLAAGGVAHGAENGAVPVYGGLDGAAGGAGAPDGAGAAAAAAFAPPPLPADAPPAPDAAAPRKRRHVWGPPAAGDFPTLEELKKPKKKKSRWEAAADEQQLALVPVKGGAAGAIIIPGQIPREVTLEGGLKVRGKGGATRACSGRGPACCSS